MIDAVLFDWGGTLSVHAAIDLADMWRLAAHHLDPAREDELCRRLVEIEARTWSWIAEDQRAATLSEILRMASDELSLDVTEAVLEEAATQHLDSWTPHIVHDPEAASMLVALRSRGIRTALLSNTHWPRAFHEHFLARDGLVDLLDARLYTSELTHTKPHAVAFQAALDAIGVTDPGRAVFVGDRLYDDVLGARSMGMRTVHRPNPSVPSYDIEPDATIQRLAELPALIDDWSKASQD